MLLNQGKRGILKMADEFNNDEKLILTKKVEDNKYELNRNAPTVDAKPNEEYATEVAPEVVDFNRVNNVTNISSGASVSKNNMSSNDQNAVTNNVNEEYAAEVAPNIVDFNRRDNSNSAAVTNDTATVNREFNTTETNVDDVTSGRGIGGLALALSILSLFVLPIVLGAAGIIIGFIARRRGATTLGAWAIGIGAVSIIVGMFVLPFF
jgi:hypothetical protein